MALATPPSFAPTTQTVLPLAKRYERGTCIETHSHEWGQLLHAISGLMWVDTPSSALLVPPQRAVWLPPGVPHGIRVVNPLQMRNLYLAPMWASTVGKRLAVLEVSPLLRELVVRRVQLDDVAQAGYAQALDNLLVMELRAAPPGGLQVPMPEAGDRRLLAVCRAVMAQPAQHLSFEQHAAEAGASTRTLARLFQAELGIGFVQWRRQVQLALAVAQRLQGIAVGRIARDLGYEPGSFSEMFRNALGAPPSAFGPNACPIP
ncbi:MULTISPECIES: helix-turn-helix domain-containing protein [unclassified Pseudomonas]|uniref:AraC family transcriptional regulator n=1 Tax=unclassified Pseudomonas TaxID=196821 RepID=UPI000BD6DADF|nr:MULTISPECIES: helix-turn-helix transcriptional regulator [unclassified Pseudomonas]PVZ19513.1 AraC-like DNA-binding protein [Pseudomonas sp. URIL14HWK12:I12]PVZ22902.1 AraC-like DNA-binding protein [Pseudomonas sp. URIL14HWK12:I10]PVZ37468.1 AraC-like DNA-binding protein [Pseudomonas sp. URIL14HWK12:I11]SNZ14867.1 transcriptional regulator, AraC family [Pseudomonas sp. URIL14HWK12:I9]